MSSDHPTSTSMASVWDTLNRMKARQAKAQSKTPRQHTTHRRDAIALFEREIATAANRGQTDGRIVLKSIREIMDADQNVRAIIDEHRRRILAHPEKELDALKKLTNHVHHELALASSAMRRANDVAHRINLQLAS